MRVCVIAALLLFPPAHLHGAETGIPETAASDTGSRIAVVEVMLPSRATLDALVDAGFDIANVRDNTATVYATPEELDELRTQGLTLRVTGYQPERADTWRKATSGYHDYAGVTQALEAYANAHTDIARLYTLGQSAEGRELWALLITDNPDVEEDEPEFKYVSTMHGDEPLGTEFCLLLIDRLLSEYSVETRVTELVDSTAIWIVPLMNPDGREAGTRFNANLVDLNRAFPEYPEDFPGTLYDGAPLGETSRQPEVAHVMRWTAENNFVLSANLHTGALVVNYPYDDDDKGSVDSPSPDDLLFEEVSRRYSQYNEPMWNSTTFSDGITNGAAWYSMEGGMQDWNYRYVACNEVTLELSNVKAPPAPEIAQFWADNEESMLTYMEAVHIGVRGLVTHAATGAPVWAEVAVAENTQRVFTDPDVGDYHRMLLPGTYTLTFDAAGYITKTYEDVDVADGATTRVDVPLSDGDVDGDGSVNAVDVQYVINAALGTSGPYECDLDGGGVTSTDVQSAVNAALAKL